MMIGEIAVVPQVEGPIRDIVTKVVAEIARRGLRYQVGATGTAVEGEPEEILAAVGAITTLLGEEGVDRAVIDIRLELEPHPETLAHQVEGIAASFASRGGSTLVGLPEQDLREDLTEELMRSMHVEGDHPTVHAIAHSLARVLEQDHLRIAEQLEQAGVRLPGAG